MTYIKEKVIAKLQKLYSLPRNLGVSSKSPVPFLKKCLSMGNSLHECKIFIERPVSLWKQWPLFSE